MKKSLPYLSAVALAAAATLVIAQHDARSKPAADGARVVAEEHPAPALAAADPAGNAAVGDRLLLQAIDQLELRDSLTARLNCWMSVSGVESDGSGNYWQQGRGESRRVRLELKLRRIEASLLQVANDRFLWVDRRLPIGRTVTRIDLRAVRTDPVLTGGRGGAAGSGQSAAPVSMDCLAETGGIPALLSSLRDNFTFSPPQAMRLEIHHPPDEQPTQLSVFALVGHWRPEKLNALLGTPGEDAPAVGEIPDEERRARPADEPGVSALAVLPERFPYEVLLLLGQGDLVPYRIEYRRRETPSPSQGASPIQDYQLSAKPLCVLELSNVAFDVTATAGLFDYAPGSAVFSDQTAALLERLRRQPPVR